MAERSADSDVALLESMGYEITDVIESVDASTSRSNRLIRRLGLYLTTRRRGNG